MANNKRSKKSNGFFNKFISNKKESSEIENNDNNTSNNDELSTKKQNPKTNIKIIMGVYLVLLFGLIGYITYFYLFKAPKINNTLVRRRYGTGPDYRHTQNLVHWYQNS